MTGFWKPAPWIKFKSEFYTAEAEEHTKDEDFQTWRAKDDIKTL